VAVLAEVDVLESEGDLLIIEPFDDPGKSGAELVPAEHVPAVPAPGNRCIPMFGCPW
jgi:hypothetical protein